MIKNRIHKVLPLPAAVLLTLLLAGCGDPAVKEQLPSPTATVAAAGSPALPSPSPGVSGSPAPTAAPTQTPAPSVSPTAVVQASPGLANEAVTPPPEKSREAAAAALEKQVLNYMVSAKSYYNQLGFSSNHYAYTADELRMLAVVIHLEARGESYGAMVAVGNVVMNRVLAAGDPGSTIAEVVTAPNQFCYNASVAPDAACLRAARDVLQYELWVIPQNTYFFRATGSDSDWGGHAYYDHIDSIAFYRDAYAGRYTGSAVPARIFKRVYKWPRYGCEPGNRVSRVQTMLSALGYDLKADGYFGTETRKQLLLFQKDHGLTADGIAGPATLTALLRLTGGAS